MPNKKPALKLKRIPSRGPLADRAYSILKDAIVQGTLDPGTWLQEEMLTQAMGISRTPLREAFNRLKGDGLIDVVPRKGARIIELSEEEIENLFEVREVMETTFFMRSVRNIPREEFVRTREKMVEAECQMHENRDNPERWEEKRREYLKVDRSLHDSLILAAGNKYWTQLYFNLRERIEICGHEVSHSPQRFPLAIEEHKAILTALIEKEFEKARDLLTEHLRSVRASVIVARRQRQERMNRAADIPRPPEAVFLK